MNTFFDARFNREVVTIYPGEYYSSFGPQYISTVLGSCVAITLFDSQHLFGGMNHFVLAKDSGTTIGDAGLTGRFGEYAVELLINDMLKKGASKANLTAKVFGGGNIFNSVEMARAPVGDENVKFAFNYLETEKIPIIASDIGGIDPRKIIYDPVTSKVWLKRIKAPEVASEIITQETNYITSVQKQKRTAGDITWF